MRLGILLSHKSHESLCQIIQIGEVADTKPFGLENAKPLLYLIHPLSE